MVTLHTRLQEIFGSLRFRLTFWNTALMLIMLAITLYGVREGVRYSLRHEADSQLQEDAVEAKLRFEELSLSGQSMDLFKKEMEDKAIAHTHRGFFVRIFNERNALHWTSPNSPISPVPLNPAQTPDQPYSILQNGRELRMIQFQPRTSDGQKWTLRVVTSFAPIELEIQRITRLIFIVGLVMMIISPLGGYWLAGRATQPLAHIINTTAGLHPAKLVERLPIRGTNDELDQLSRTINQLLDRIAAYLVQNQEFTANAAHELRSPLAAIQGAIEVTLAHDRSPDEYRNLITDILEESQDLSRLVNQLLLLAESDAGRLVIATEAFDLTRLVQRSVDMFQGVAESRNMAIRFRSPEEIPFQGDAARLRQVLNNLLDNALKFSPNGSEVQVALTTDPAQQQIQLRISDAGVGISKEDLPHVFERFFRGDRARDRDGIRKGTGLGLTICQSIIEAHGGIISAESMSGRGTMFVVLLPWKTPVASPAIE